MRWFARLKQNLLNVFNDWHSVIDLKVYSKKVIDYFQNKNAANFIYFKTAVLNCNQIKQNTYAVQKFENYWWSF